MSQGVQAAFTEAALVPVTPDEQGASSSVGFAQAEHLHNTERINTKLSFAVLNLVAIGFKAVDVLAKCLMTTAAYLASGVFLKFIPVVGAVISFCISLFNVAILATNMSRCASKLKEVKAQQVGNGNLDVIQDIEIYSIVKKIEIIMHMIVLGLSVVAVGMVFFPGAAFFLPGLIAVIAISIILYIAYQIIHYTCNIDKIEKIYELNVPLS